MKNSHMPAFINHGGNGTSPSRGLTKREYFAAMAMQAVIAVRDIEKIGSEMVATKAIAYADELLKQLDK